MLMYVVVAGMQAVGQHSLQKRQHACRGWPEQRALAHPRKVRRGARRFPFRGLSSVYEVEKRLETSGFPPKATKRAAPWSQTSHGTRDPTA